MGKHRRSGLRPAEIRNVIALIPAHNEADAIADSIQGLYGQILPPWRVIVVADNCTDTTVAIADSLGAEVFETQGNRHKKAGGLNQALARLLPALHDDDVVLVTDADSALDPGFVACGVEHLAKGYGGVGGTFRGGPGGGFVGHLQRNEYARYSRDVKRLGGKCLVLTGTAAMFRVQVLRQISQARLEGRLPAGDGRGGIYDTSVLTEDNELTFAVLHLGYQVLSPEGCTLTTEVMLTWKALWDQRLRWKRGAVENCVQYGLTRITWRYWGRQLLSMVGVLVTAVYLATLAYALASHSFHVNEFWLWVSLVFVIERVVTVRELGWKRMLLAASMYELLFDFLLQACHAKAYLDSVFRRERAW
ncbi:glycosyltransferase family 2 protein [Streptomyces sp. NPDC056231]|uniref:glycosyltransferase family 2 protein n=1 Tax=Streptomyces sp. NPDC056231 TaxID=3345755 RepID=UPI003AAB39B2